MPSTMKKPSTALFQDSQEEVSQNSQEEVSQNSQEEVATLPMTPPEETEVEATEATTPEETAEQVSMEDLLPGEDESSEACQSEPEQEAEERAGEQGEQESPASQVAQPMTSSLSDADILVQIYNAEFSCASAEAIVEELKSDLKAAKERYDGCVDKLRELARRVRNDSIENRPLFSQIKSDQPPVVIPAPPATNEEAEQPESNFDPDAWKSEPLSVLADSEGITAKLLEKLAESNIDNLGDLEALRAEIANGKESWPKGVGEKKVTAIENAIVEWLAKWNAIQQAAANTSSETADAASEVDTEATFGEGYPTEEEWNAMHDETQISWLNARAVFLEEKAAAHPDGVMDGLDNGNAEGTEQDWFDGHDAFDNGEEIKNCELSPGLECDAWLMGWMYAAKEEGEGEE